MNKIKILFICHGNICRSPMAEFIMKDLIKKENLEEFFVIDSKATSTEELGNNIHYGTREILNKYNIPYTNHYASQVTKDDYNYYDYLICMDENNIRNLHRIVPSDKTIKLNNKDIADPWYTHNFELTYQEVLQGCKNLLNKLRP